MKETKFNKLVQAIEEREAVRIATREKIIKEHNTNIAKAETEVDRYIRTQDQLAKENNEADFIKVSTQIHYNQERIKSLNRQIREINNLPLWSDEEIDRMENELLVEMANQEEKEIKEVCKLYAEIYNIVSDNLKRKIKLEHLLKDISDKPIPEEYDISRHSRRGEHSPQPRKMYDEVRATIHDGVIADYMKMYNIENPTKII